MRDTAAGYNVFALGLHYAHVSSAVRFGTITVDRSESNTPQFDLDAPLAPLKTPGKHGREIRGFYPGRFARSGAPKARGRSAMNGTSRARFARARARAKSIKVHRKHGISRKSASPRTLKRTSLLRRNIAGEVQSIDQGITQVVHNKSFPVVR